eukprot:6464088-Amphidinium_carterae.2
MFSEVSSNRFNTGRSSSAPPLQQLYVLRTDAHRQRMRPQPMQLPASALQLETPEQNRADK